MKTNPDQQPDKRPDRRADRPVADSVPTSWVDAMPSGLRPYLRLARYDRPIGFWLLLIPCWQGLMLGRIGTGPETGLGWVDLYYAILFAIGAIAMRGAGCTYNDIVDRDLDAQVARTADRPLAAGTVSLKSAWVFLIAQSLVGFLVLIQLPWPAIVTGLAALVLVAAYPFMKRITWWPQAWLGLTFNWGIPVGYVTATGSIDPAMIALYIGALFWTVGYDTIYACQDIEDDALIGVKSSARALGDRLVPGVSAFYIMAFSLAVIAGVLASAPLIFALGVSGYAAHLLWQVSRLKTADGADYLTLFKSNRTAGLILAGAMALSAMGTGM